MLTWCAWQAGAGGQDADTLQAMDMMSKQHLMLHRTATVLSNLY